MPQASASTGLHPLVDALADRIRHCRDGLPGLEPLAIDPELEAISGSLDGEDLFIRNEVHRCRGLRKLHLETARLGAGLQILHCVFFPDPRFDLPVFGADIVAGRGVVSAAIVDLSPVTDGLPSAMEAALQALARPPFSQPRELPGWGAIFSPHVLFVRPADAGEQTWFVDTVAAYTGRDVDRLMADTGIVRNRAKIEATIANARAAADLDIDLCELLWSFAPPPRPRPATMAEVPSQTPESAALARELRRRGFRFVGPTTAYALMQATGMVDDHVRDCLVPPAATAGFTP